MTEKFHVNLSVGGEPCRAEIVPRFARFVGIHHVATAPALVTVRGSASGRVIEPGDVFGPEDGDLILTSANLGAASALFGWLP